MEDATAMGGASKHRRRTTIAARWRRDEQQPRRADSLCVNAVDSGKYGDRITVVDS